MKRYQEIEFERHCKSLKAFLNKLQKKHPELFEIWGEQIEYNINHGTTCEIEPECGYILHTINDDNFYYICFIATNEQQVINE